MKGSPVDPERVYVSQTSGWFGQLFQAPTNSSKTSVPAWREAGRRRTAWLSSEGANRFTYDSSERLASR